MKRWLWSLVGLGLMVAACAPAGQAAPAAGAPGASIPEQENAVSNPSPDGPLAPELKNEVWLNTEPLAAADLRGKVVLIDFWTFG